MSEKTAYEQSAAVGYALLNQLSAEQEAQEKASELKRMHKTVARVWFDLLEQFDPPTNTPEWWAMATAKMNDAYNQAGKPVLLQDMILALMAYLDRKAKDGEGVKE